MLEAATVAEAIARLADQPRWVLLDLMLPDGCGSQILERIKDERLPTDVCVVTGCSGPILERVRAMGAEHIFVKPVDVEELIALLRQDVPAASRDELAPAEDDSALT